VALAKVPHAGPHNRDAVDIVGDMRSMQVIVALLALALGSPYASICLAHEVNCVSVRVLNSKNGKAVEGVSIKLSPASTERPRISYVGVSIGKTDKHGIAKYCFPGSLPRSFRLQLYEFNGPDEAQIFDTEAVLKYGVVTTNFVHGKKSSVAQSPKPGEVVMFGQRWGFIDRWWGDWP